MRRDDRDHVVWLVGWLLVLLAGGALVVVLAWVG
jgi:hypothetical protein